MVRIRLSRAGRKKHPVYRMIVVDSRKPRETKAIEYIGTYDPILKTGNINVEKAKEWIAKGAQPSERALKILKSFGLEQ
ncbi:SSU ribosomal protein S16P [Venenivibrio stagnispumantis]|uniref:Small ribosomal subunit protein bS16 n=1 Tax=Venenivibrio stagnispumantis TaxID=407998 RepID=A0AA46AFU6_9AQUI|nr:30S ribosomal protein S16 [Venenivibrio stagnispumantis]MCW4573905.1 30S ribosomal protein S16 [Venenivibrio stagnispumantis]SMP22162.1 SSU ribosomal protein S16P [Venenivibrio stagnispumantis]